MSGILAQIRDGECARTASIDVFEVISQTVPVVVLPTEKDGVVEDSCESSYEHTDALWSPPSLIDGWN